METDEGTVLISTEMLAENTMPGLSGAPVVDSRGAVIGLMSQKAGRLERLSSVEYPREFLARRAAAARNQGQATETSEEGHHATQ